MPSKFLRCFYFIFSLFIFRWKCQPLLGISNRRRKIFEGSLLRLLRSWRSPVIRNTQYKIVSWLFNSWLNSKICLLCNQISMSIGIWCTNLKNDGVHRLEALMSSWKMDHSTRNRYLALFIAPLNIKLQKHPDKGLGSYYAPFTVKVWILSCSKWLLPLKKQSLATVFVAIWQLFVSFSQRGQGHGWLVCS